MRISSFGSQAATLLLLFFHIILPAQSTFQRFFSDADSTMEGGRMVQLSNNNILIAGLSSTDLVEFDGTFWLIKPDGSTLQSKMVNRTDGSNTLLISEVEATADSGFILLVNDFIGSKTDKRIVKANQNGNVVWTKQLLENTSATLTSIKSVTNGFLITAEGPPEATTLLKINTSGTQVWSKTIKDVNFRASGVFEASNGDLFIPGYSVSAGGKGAFIKMDINGSLLTTKLYGPSATQTFLGPLTTCLKMGTDSLLFVGSDNNKDLILLKTDLSGTPGSIARYQTVNNSSPVGAFLNSSGEVVVGILRGAADGGSALARFSNSLQFLGGKTYGKTGGGALSVYHINKTNNQSGYLLTGSFSNNSKNNVWFAQTDAAGDIQGRCCPKNSTLTKTPATITAITTILTLLPSPNLADASTSFQTFTTDNDPFCTSEEQIVVSNPSFCPGQCVNVSITNAQTGTPYSWTFQSGIPASSTAVSPGQVCYNTVGTFEIQLLTEGCQIDTASVVVENFADQFPNAFSPNGDTNNDIFMPIVKCPIEDYLLQIFNRWGDLVFESYDINEGWNGEVNGKPAPVDVYIYRAEYYALRDGVRTLIFNEKKEVTLVR